MSQIEPILLDRTGRDIVAMLTRINDSLNDAPIQYPASLNEASWSMIQNLAATDSFRDYYSVGDVKGVELTIRGNKCIIPAVVIGVNTYAEHTIDFLFTMPFEAFDMNQTLHHNNMSYASSDYAAAPVTTYTGLYGYFHSGIACDHHSENPMQQAANGMVFNTVIPSDLRAVIVPKVAKYMGFTVNDDSVITLTSIECSNKLWIPTYYELTGKSWTDASGYSDKISAKYQHNYGINNVNQTLPFSNTVPSFIQFVSATTEMQEEGDTFQYTTSVPIIAMQANSTSFSVSGMAPTSLNNMAPVIYGFTVGVTS